MSKRPPVQPSPQPSTGEAPAPPAAASDSSDGAAILFTAFEPSGDAHAAPVIRELLRRQPSLRIFAWGGPKMEAAGATIVEESAGDGTMGLGAIAKIFAMRKEHARIKRWSTQYRVVVHVPVDSPAANFPVCKAMQKQGARIVHLVAPQLWAWGARRIKKLRRLTSLVLCLLPFEEQYFTKRQVPAKFIGHPSINRPLNKAEIVERIKGLPTGAPKVAIFPGSRSQEVRANIRLLVAAYNELQGRNQGLAGLIVAANENIAKLVRKRVRVFPAGLHMAVGSADAAIAWSDLCLCVSGTVTMDVARQRKPMVGVYKTGIISWLGAKIVLRTPFRLLPNIVAQREIVPEFVPHAFGAMPIVNEAHRILSDSRHVATQTEELTRLCQAFSNHDPAHDAAEAILGVIGKGAKSRKTNA